MVEPLRPSVVKVESGNSSGSGVVIRTGDGGPYTYVLTNHHVIDGSSQANIIFSDGSRRQAEVSGYDEVLDLAVVKAILAKKPQVATMSTEEARVGQEVFTMGYPLGGNTATVTRGIISAVWEDDARWLIQTDAPINPGNSGGPLFNRDGEVVGINTFVIRQSGGIAVEGFGFAIAARTINNALGPLISGRKAAAPTPTPRATPTPQLRTVTFPTRTNIVRSLDRQGLSIRWRARDSAGGDRYYYGDFSDGYFGMRHVSRPTEILVFLEDGVRATRYREYIAMMLESVGYRPDDAESIAQGLPSNMVLPTSYRRCLALGDVLITSTDSDSDPTRYITVITSSDHPSWSRVRAC